MLDINARHFKVRSSEGTDTAYISTSLSDAAWDCYLQSTPLGHFQQSSIWGSVKAFEGWEVIRVVVWSDDKIQGGFQILTRSRGMLREGFLNKGPVWDGINRGLLEWLFSLVDQVVEEFRIDLLIVQAADSDRIGDTHMGNSAKFAVNGLAKIITATFCVPLGPTFPPVETRMRRTIRLETRQALKRGVVVREGGAKDLPTFFQMMCTTCRRQGASPNPATEQTLLHLWEAFHARSLARLTIADCDGEPTAGLLSIRFGERVTQWKKGWNETHANKHPNTLLAVESIRWAEQNGARLVDFVGGDRTYARALLAGSIPTEEQRSSRYFFIVGFGAEPMILPLGHVLIRNRSARLLYRMSIPLLRKVGRVEV